ncbi:MAG: translation elongation factor Ts [Clostridiales bacterium]|nr:translation elongation factor Ts [Clostridiales bacterium]
MAISAKDVAELRRKTGAGMMECKKALTETNGDFDEAIKYLRESGVAVAAKKADRIAADGRIDIACEGDSTAMIEINCETDFVANTDGFKAFSKNVLAAILANRPADVDALLECKYSDTLTVGQALTEMIANTKENTKIRRFVIVDGLVSTYIHGNGVTGVIVKFEADPAIAETEGFKECAKNVALQIAAMNCQYLDRDSVPQSAIDEEKEVIMKTIQNDPKNASKPAAIIEKMATGRLGKFYESYCLVDQVYIKDDSMTVGKYVEATAKSLGGAIKLVAYVRYDKGEGIEKRSDDLAAEIDKLVNKK